MFIYFDLGNVLLNFDNRRGCRQMSAVTGLAPDLIYRVLFSAGLKEQYERGEFTPEQYFAAFCQQTGCTCERADWQQAGNDIFEVNPSMAAVVAQLASAGYRLGLLSNVCQGHWQYVTAGRFNQIFEHIRVHALSYEIGVMKPDPAIFSRAAELAGVAPGDIFYCDDILGHVVAACQAGFDAVQYTTTEQYIAELAKRGISIRDRG